MVRLLAVMSLVVCVALVGAAKDAAEVELDKVTQLPPLNDAALRQFKQLPGALFGKVKSSKTALIEGNPPQNATTVVLEWATALKGDLPAKLELVYYTTFRVKPAFAEGMAVIVAFDPTPKENIANVIVPNDPAAMAKVREALGLPKAPGPASQSASGPSTKPASTQAE